MAEHPKSIARSLGEFFGHVWKGVKTPASGAQKSEMRREVRTETRDAPEGKVVLRRTVIEEVELPNGGAPGEPPQPPR